MFTASIALTKTTLESIIEDEEIAIEEDDDPFAELLDPLQGILDQTKSIRVHSKYASMSINGREVG